MMKRMDRKVYKLQTVQEADHTLDYWMKQSAEDRWKHGIELSLRAHGFDPTNPPKMAKHIYTVRKRNQN